jgi:hypothetical protein
MTHRRWLLWSGLAVIAAALAGPAIVPLYDGVGFPDEPYRYIGHASPPPPAPVSQTVPKSSLSQVGITLQSQETGPQIKVVFSVDAITLPEPASQLQLSSTPEAPTTQPSTGTVASNVYFISGTSQPGPPTVKPGFANVYLRLPQGVSFKTQPTIIYRAPGQVWKWLRTDQTGTDVYMAEFKDWGEYALAVDLPKPGEGNATSGRPSPWGAWFAGILVLAAIVVAIALIRLRSRRDTPKRK